MCASREGAWPRPPKNGSIRRGWVSRVEPEPEPVLPQATNPDLITSSGAVPNQAGFHSTMSASRPGCSDPTWSAIPCATAGLWVSLAR